MAGKKKQLGSNVETFTALVERLRARDAMVDDTMIRLGLSLATDMDAADANPTTPAGVLARNAGLVKQYRELLEVMTGDDSDEDEEIWEQFHAAGRKRSGT